MSRPGRRIDDEQVRDALAVRAVLDGLAAATTLTESDPVKLATILTAQEENLRYAAHPARDTELDLEFHTLSEPARCAA